MFRGPSDILLPRPVNQISGEPLITTAFPRESVGLSREGVGWKSVSSSEGLLARHIRRVVAGRGFTVLGMYLLLFSQDELSPSLFEFETPQEFAEIVDETPMPALRVSHPNTPGSNSQFRGLQGIKAELHGKLIDQDGLTMIEMAPETLRVDRSIAASHAEELKDLGVHTLRGEIVNSKCYFGVMNPGHGKVHRGCPVRCLSGGTLNATYMFSKVISIRYRFRCISMRPQEGLSGRRHQLFQRGLARAFQNGVPPGTLQHSPGLDPALLALGQEKSGEIGSK